MNSDRFDTPVMGSVYGNAASHDATVALAAADIGTVVDMVQLPAGTRVTDVKLINENLGATSTLKVGYRYANPSHGTADDDYFLAAATSASAGARTSAAFPKLFKHPIIITITTGVAATTGKVCVIPSYVYVGNL